MKPYYSFCATNCHIITCASHVCFISSNFIKVALKVVKQEAKAGFGQPEKNNTTAGLLCKATSGKTGLLTKSN